MRRKYVFAIASKIKRCGEDIDDGCGCLRATKIKNEDLATIIMEWSGVNKETIDQHQGNTRNGHQNLQTYFGRRCALYGFQSHLVSSRVDDLSSVGNTTPLQMIGVTFLYAL